MAYVKSKDKREIRHKRVRRKVIGDAERPRLSVFRALRHIYAQVIDDSNGRTLVSASSLDEEIKSRASGLKKTEVAALVGALVAQKCKSKGINKVVFDRGGYKFHGRVKALADAARSSGLEF